jgi:transposase
MRIIKQNVGVDISKSTFDVRFVELDENHEVKYKRYKKFQNSIEGIKSFTQWCDQQLNINNKLHITMEATGVYYESLAYTMSEDDRFVVHVVLPNMAKKYFESLNTKNKTDKIDAKNLGLLGIERDLRIFKPKSHIYIHLRKLSREKEQLTDERSGIKNQRHAETHSKFPLKKTITRYNNRIKYIDNQILAVDNDIIKLVSKDEYVSNKVKKIKTIPGVGFHTIVGIIAETGGFETFTSIKQLTSYSGMDVQIMESGQWKGKSRISKRGNSHIRRLLYMPTLSTVRCAQKHKKKYERINEGKTHKMTGVIAIQRSLLGLIYTLWKNDTEYDDNYDANTDVEKKYKEAS